MYYHPKQVFLRQNPTMTENVSNKKKNILTLFRILFVVAGVIVAVYWSAQDDRWRKLLEINPLTLLLVLIIFAMCQVLVGLRWWILLRPQKVFISLWFAIKLHFLGLFYNNCMPGSVGGDLIRAWYVTLHTEKKIEAALSVFVDRIIGLFSTLVIAVSFYMIFLRDRSLEISTKQSSLIASLKEHRSTAICALLAVIALVIAAALIPRTRKFIKPVISKILQKTLKILEKLKNAAIIYGKNPVSIIAAFALTVTLQITQITGFWLIGRNLGIEASIWYYYVFFTLTWVLGAVPVSIGGAVVVEAILVVFFVKIANTPQDAALALAISQRFVWILTSLLGAVVHVSGKHLPRQISIDADQNMQ
jgi:uncharacterized protein (TIRG00374 family)